MAATPFAVETERLLLRPVTPADFDFALSLYLKPEVARYLGPPKSPEDLRRRLEHSVEHEQRHGFSRWMAILKSTGEPIGRCGPLHQTINGKPEVELGYAFDQPYWGRGYASEALRGVIDYCFTVQGHSRLAAIIDPPNLASINVVRKNGMLFERVILWDGVRVRLYALHRHAPNIRPVTVAEAGLAQRMIEDAADWLLRSGQPMWTREELDPRLTESDVLQKRLFFAEVAGHPAGLVRFQLDDPEFWPDAVSGEAAYVHRLVVRREYAGQGVSAALLRWAVDQTSLRNRQFLRLDCDASRLKLRALYEGFGFVFHSHRQVGPHYVARYQYDLA